MARSSLLTDLRHQSTCRLGNSPLTYAVLPLGTPRDFNAVRIQSEYDPDDLATKITTQLVHKSISKTYLW
jgi:hypothetical protein